MSEQQRKPYSKPSLTCYRDLRTITLGNSIFEGESQGTRAPNDFTQESIFEQPRRGSTDSESSSGRSGRQ
jgi:hypothetical protein